MTEHLTFLAYTSPAIELQTLWPTFVLPARTSLLKINWKWLSVSFLLCPCCMPVVVVFYFFTPIMGMVQHFTLCVGGSTAQQTSCAPAPNVPAWLGVWLQVAHLPVRKNPLVVSSGTERLCGVFCSFWVLLSEYIFGSLQRVSKRKWRFHRWLCCEGGKAPVGL